MSFIAKRRLIIFSLYFNIEIKGDNFQYNTYNKWCCWAHQYTDARFYDEMAHGITVYDGTPIKNTLLLTP